MRFNLFSFIVALLLASIDPVSASRNSENPGAHARSLKTASVKRLLRTDPSKEERRSPSELEERAAMTASEVAIAQKLVGTTAKSGFSKLNLDIKTFVHGNSNLPRNMVDKVFASPEFKFWLMKNLGEGNGAKVIRILKDRFGRKNVVDAIALARLSEDLLPMAKTLEGLLTRKERLAIGLVKLLRKKV